MDGSCRAPAHPWCEPTARHDTADTAAGRAVCEAHLDSRCVADEAIEGGVVSAPCVGCARGGRTGAVGVWPWRSSTRTGAVEAQWRREARRATAHEDATPQICGNDVAVPARATPCRASDHLGGQWHDARAGASPSAHELKGARARTQRACATIVCIAAGSGALAAGRGPVVGTSCIRASQRAARARRSR